MHFCLIWEGMHTLTLRLLFSYTFHLKSSLWVAYSTLQLIILQANSFSHERFAHYYGAVDGNIFLCRNCIAGKAHHVILNLILNLKFKLSNALANVCVCSRTADMPQYVVSIVHLSIVNMKLLIVVLWLRGWP